MNDPPDLHRLQKKLERAQIYLTRNDLVAARAAFEAIVATHPGFPPATFQLFRLAEGQGRYRDAHALAVGMSAGRPGDGETILRIAQGLARHGESLLASSWMRQVLADSYSNPVILRELAQLAITLNETEFARNVIDRLSALQPDLPSVIYQQGILAVFSGNLGAAERAFERCLRLAPDFGQAHWSISKLRRQTNDSNHVDRLRKRLAEATDRNVPSLAFALFKELDDLGEYEDAWTALAQGCQVKRASLKYQAADDRAGFQALQRLHAEGHFSNGRASASMPSGPMPIFIVGLPRSGTTVLEQLLALHPDIQSTGELPDFAAQMRWVGNRYSRSQLDAALIEVVARSNDHEVGVRYLQRTQWRAQGKARYIDKTPMNFANVGFILRSIPNAKIIHIRKSPMDACFSNLKELFTRMYPHSYQLDEMADYYSQYSSLMSGWHSLASATSPVLDVDYEQLVTAPEATMRSVLLHIGVPWCDDCGGSVGTNSDVTTASAVQVREPIHSRALGQWKNYAQWLGPLIDKVA